MCRNPECNKKLPDGLNYCGEDCLRRHIQIKKEAKFKEACPESAKILNEKPKETERTNKPKTIFDILTNPVYQRGAGYRAEKLRAIWIARQDGMSDEQIRRLLLRGGLTKQTINVMMQDSKEAYEEVNQG